ncbi:MAG: FecR family protein, partial [Deltaproteobacteria bacterium]|nr:FecR family protein [Deltaproteobacteria bacterium]
MALVFLVDGRMFPRFKVLDMLKIFWLLGLIFFACFVGTTLAQAQNQADSPIIIKVAGKAEILAQGRRLKAREGQILAPGQSIQLIGGGEVRLSTSNGKIKVKVFDDTIVKFDGQVEANSQPWSPPTSQYEKTSTTPSSHKAPQFVVPVGKLEVQVEPGQELRVVCPLIMAAVRGTLFTVNVSGDGTSRVETLDGRVATYGRNGEIHLTSSGQSSQVTARAYVS